MAVRFLLIALVTGATTSIVATGRVTWSLVLSGTLCWSFVPAVQLMTAAALVRSGPRPVRTADGVTALFARQPAWPVWLLAAALFVLIHPGLPIRAVVASAAVPAALTIPRLYRFSREELGATASGAAIRTACHQVVTWTIVLTYIALATQLLPRVTSAVEP